MSYHYVHPHSGVCPTPLCSKSLHQPQENVGQLEPALTEVSAVQGNASRVKSLTLSSKSRGSHLELSEKIG